MSYYYAYDKSRKGKDIRLCGVEAIAIINAFPLGVRNDLYRSACHFSCEVSSDEDGLDIFISNLERLAYRQIWGKSSPPQEAAVLRRFTEYVKNLATNMRKVGVDESDAEHAWSSNIEVYRLAALKIKGVKEGVELGIKYRAEESNVNLVAQGMRRRGRALRRLVDHVLCSAGHRSFYLGARTRNIITDRERAGKDGLQRRCWTDGERIASLHAIKEHDRLRKRAETTVTLKGLHQVADERGYTSVMLTVTLPEIYDPGNYIGKSPDDGKAALIVLIRRFRAALAAMHGPYEVDSWHGSRETALKRKAEIELSRLWVARTRKVDGRWTTQRARRIGFEAMGVIAWHPTKGKAPHLHIPLRCDPALVDSLRKWLAKQQREYGCDLTIADDSQDKSSATNYALRFVLRDSVESEEVERWARENEIRPMSWVGITPMRTVWRAIYATGEEEIPVVRGQIARQAMMVEQFGTALSVIGAIASMRDEFPRLALRYETIVSASGNPRRRPFGVYDPIAAEQGMIRLRPPGIAWETQEDDEIIKTPIGRVTALRDCPTSAAACPPDEWLEWCCDDAA